MNLTELMLFLLRSTILFAVFVFIALPILAAPVIFWIWFAEYFGIVVPIH